MQSQSAQLLSRVQLIVTPWTAACQAFLVKCWAEWITGWNQDCWEKYQQPQICSWYYPDDRKYRGIKEPLDESERGEWISWLKTTFRWSGDITSWRIDGETMETLRDFIWGGPKITADCDCSHEIKRHLLLGRKAMKNLDSILKTRDFTDKGLYSQIFGFSSSHIWMWQLDHKESWEPKNWCFWTVVLEKTRESLGLQGDQTSQS